MTDGNAAGARLIIPHRMFDELAAGRGGPAAARLLSSAARGRTLVLLKSIADEASGAARAAFREFARFYEFAPERVDGLLRYPAVGAWALDALRAARGDAAASARPEDMAALAAAAAVRARAPAEIGVPVRGGGVLLPSLGRARPDAPSGECLVRVTSGGARVVGGRVRIDIPAEPGRDAAGWLGLRVLRPTTATTALRLIVDDLDPHRFPVRGPLAGRQSDAQIADWEALLRDAWTLLWRRHRDVAQEVAGMLSVLMPLTGTGGFPASATSRSAFGGVALAPPPDAVSLAAALAHEVQHAKLTMLFHLVDLVRPDAPGRYYAPWRNDPRPLTGLFHGTYAHLGVAAFWGRRRRLTGDAVAHTEFARWREAAAQTAESLRASAALTPLGHRFLDGMLRTLREFQDEPVPAQARELARRASARHRRTFDARNVPQAASPTPPSADRSRDAP